MKCPLRSAILSGAGVALTTVAHRLTPAALFGADMTPVYRECLSGHTLVALHAALAVIKICLANVLSVIKTFGTVEPNF